MRHAIALLLGISLTFGYAPFSFWPVVLLSLSGFVYLLSQCRPSQAFFLGLNFGIGWFGAGIAWVHVSIEQFGGLPLVVSLGLMVLLVAYLALYPALAAYLLKRFFTTSLWPLAAPMIWLGVEWLRSWMLTGFPWLSIGYSQIDGPLSGWMPVIGEFGLSGLILLLVTSLAVYLPVKKWLPAGLVASVLLLGGWTLQQLSWVQPTGKSVSMAMVQGNIKQELRWIPEQDKPTMDKYLTLSEPHWHNQVIIWPEAAIPKLEPIATDYIKALDEKAAQYQTGLITGIVNYNFETREAYNNLIGLGSRDGISNQGHYRYLHSNRFSKHHLLPIGEFIPLENWLRGLAPLFDLPMSSFSRGDYQQHNLVAGGFDFAPAICFEIAFPRQIGANLYPHTDFIITVSNDAWFGDSHGPAQHLEIAQVRAKEFGLPVLRATNNGITAFVDHQGQIQSRLPQFKEGVLTDKIALVEGYTPYRRFGDLSAWLLFGLAFVLALVLRRKSL